MSSRAASFRVLVVAMLVASAAVASAHTMVDHAHVRRWGSAAPVFVFCRGRGGWVQQGMEIERPKRGRAGRNRVCGDRGALPCHFTTVARPFPSLHPSASPAPTKKNTQDAPPGRRKMLGERGGFRGVRVV